MNNTTLRMVLSVLAIIGLIVICSVVLGYNEVRCNEFGGNMVMDQTGLPECLQR